MCFNHEPPIIIQTTCFATNLEKVIFCYSSTFHASQRYAEEYFLVSNLIGNFFECCNISPFHFPFYFSPSLFTFPFSLCLFSHFSSLSLFTPGKLSRYEQEFSSISTVIGICLKFKWEEENICKNVRDAQKNFHIRQRCSHYAKDFSKRQFL